MLKIGITGGIGSGKTTVCKVFELLGVPVFYADSVAKEIMISDVELVSGIKVAFGASSYFPDDSLNRKHLSDIVFNNPDQLKKLNGLVHPAVFRAFDKWMASLPPETPYILKEAALLFESGSYKMCDKTLMVIAPEAVRIDRVMLRDGLTLEQVRLRMDQQWSEEKKLHLADFEIQNSTDKSIIEQVLALHQLFLKG